ncbi:MAG TPA: ribbon-helix-helix domain-containing protein [Thermoprotei archaeon]|nr:ribbon-helix-helix domain-containing protein [Thermoprotei archaeon]
MVKVKTSIYVDKDLWERFKKYASKKGVEISELLEEIIREEMFEDDINNILTELTDIDAYEIDFEPIEVKGDISKFIRVLRDERYNNISR